MAGPVGSPAWLIVRARCRFAVEVNGPVGLRRYSPANEVNTGVRMMGQKTLSLVSNEAHPRQGERRSQPRYRVFLKATIITTTSEQPVRVRDMSVGGAFVEGNAPFVADTDVMLRRGSTELFARVAWTAGTKCGLAFEEALTDQELAEFIHQPVRGDQRLPQSLPPRPTLEPEKLTPEQWAMIEAWGRPTGRGALGE